MAHILVDGIVSDVQRGTETTGGGSSYRGTGSMQISTSQITTMRIGSKAAEVKSKGMFIVKDGERVIAAGKEKGGVLKIGAARNLTAGTVYHPPVIAVWIAAGASLLLGIPLSLIIIGLPFLGLGIYLIYLALGWKKSIAMVEEASSNAKPLAAAASTS